jgi:hypothetical protein
MDARGIAAVALRVWGLILLLSVISALPGVIMGLTASAYPDEQAAFIRASQVGTLLTLLANAALGAATLLWAETVAKLALPETAPIAVDVDAGQLLSVGLALVGAVTLMCGLEEVAGLGYVLRRKPSGVDLSNTQYLWERDAEAMVRACVKVAAGLILLLGRSGISRSWAQVRSIAQTGRGLTRG